MSTKSNVLLAGLLGGAVVWLWKKAREESGGAGHRDITRWEDEGGALPDGEQMRARPSARGRRSLRVASSGGATAPDEVGSTPDAWKFPRS